MPRAQWKGFLRLSLVSIGVEMFNAVETKGDVSFNLIHKPTGQRVKYKKTAGGEEIDNADIVKGYEVERDQYVTFTPEELDAVKLETKKTLDLTEFVDVSQIDPRYFERPYYLAPADEVQAEGYLVIREALAKMEKLGLGQVAMSGREHLVAVGPLSKGLGLQILRYADEVKKADSFFGGIPALKLDPEMVALATQLIERKSATDFHPEKWRNHYADAVKALVAEKMKGHKIVATEEPMPRGNVVNLMDALRKSVQGDAAKKSPAQPKPIAKKRRSTR